MRLEAVIEVEREVGDGEWVPYLVDVSGEVEQGDQEYLVSLDSRLDLRGLREIDQAENALMQAFDAAQLKSRPYVVGVPA